MATARDSRFTSAAAVDRKVDFTVQLLQHQSEETSKQSFHSFRAQPSRHPIKHPKRQFSLSVFRKSTRFAVRITLIPV